MSLMHGLAWMPLKAYAKAILWLSVSFSALTGICWPSTRGHSLSEYFGPETRSIISYNLSG